MSKILIGIEQKGEDTLIGWWIGEDWATGQGRRPLVCLVSKTAQRVILSSPRSGMSGISWQEPTYREETFSSRRYLSSVAYVHGRNEDEEMGWGNFSQGTLEDLLVNCVGSQEQQPLPIYFGICTAPAPYWLTGTWHYVSKSREFASLGTSRAGPGRVWISRECPSSCTFHAFKDHRPPLGRHVPSKHFLPVRP